MTKFKHNKKRNTAFLYETLVLELTRAILKSDIDSKNKIMSLIKEAFSRNKVLYRDLKLYHSLSQTKNLNIRTAEKILTEVKNTRKDIDKKKLLSEQNSLARKIKKYLSDDVLSNFVPNYKTLATISQIFNQRAPIKTRVLLENEIIGQMSISDEEAEKQKMVPMDNLVYKTFAKKFNKEYSNGLLKEQKELLSKFVSSFTDNGLQLKVYLNEEIKRLKAILDKSLLIEEFVADEAMQQKAKSVISILESYKQRKPEKEMVQQVIKIQGLVSEIRENATN
jgi:hypothetical protein